MKKQNGNIFPVSNVTWQDLIHIAQYRNSLSDDCSSNTRAAFEVLARQVRMLRMSRDQDRFDFAYATGVNVLDLIALENLSCNSVKALEVISCINRICDSHLQLETVGTDSD